MLVAGMRTGGERIETPDLVRQPMLHKEIQRAVGHRRLCPEPRFGKAFKDLVGAKCPVLFQQDLQRLPANRRQTRPAFAGYVFRSLKHRGGASCMVVGGEGVVVLHDFLLVML